MATGTEGPDYLVNDTSVMFDTINALGGDDTIQIYTVGEEHVVTVNGGGGFDTLRVGGFIWGAGSGGVITGQGTFSPYNEVYYGGIERLIIDGTALSYTDQYGIGLPVYLTTGDTIDEITLSSLRHADVIVTTGGGDDKIYLNDVGPFSEVRGGTGNDLISLAGHWSNWTFALGEEGNDTLVGGLGNNILDGGPGNDFLNLGAGGGDEVVAGGSGNDVFYFGGTLTTTDRIDGGSDVDRLVLQGDYGSELLLTPRVRGIETLSLLSAGDGSFSGGGGGPYDYVLTAHDSNFASGVQARIDGGGLLAGEDLTFNGSAETDARFLVYGGKGTDRVTGGTGNDIFFFGLDGRFAPGDSIDGGAGSDSLFLRGNYTIDFNAPGYAGALANLEALNLLPVGDERYARGGGTEFDYSVIWADAMLGAGGTITVSGTTLAANETMTFEGSRETDGSFQILAGAGSDLLSGGSGADLLFGGLGADRLIGNGGNDLFRYGLAAESTSAARDSIRDFSLGDRVDLLAIDANTLAPGNHAFSFIGTAAFGNRAGELRVENQGGPVWLVQGDTNGDGLADFELSLVVVDAHPITAADFTL